MESARWLRSSSHELTARRIPPVYQWVMADNHPATAAQFSTEPMTYRPMIASSVSIVALSRHQTS